MGTLPFKQVDVFTQKPFWGNPVAVVIGAEMLATEEMQRIAAWTNLSETTFLLPPSSNQADYRLRIFSPKQEMPFAGHPTVGSAHAVIESGYATSTDGKLRQECLAGILDLAVNETALGKQIFVQAPQPTITAMSGALTTALMERWPSCRPVGSNFSALISASSGLSRMWGTLVQWLPSDPIWRRLPNSVPL